MDVELSFVLSAGFVYQELPRFIPGEFLIVLKALALPLRFTPETNYICF